MPRKPRVEIAGGIHHVFARGNNKALLFFDEACVLGSRAAPAWLELRRLYERFEGWGGEPRAGYLEAVAQRVAATAA